MPKDESEQAQLREICSSLAWFVDTLLRTNERWNPYYWVDAIVPTSATALSARELHVEGIMIWGEHKQRGEWIEPLSATLRVSEGGNGLAGYQIMCVDATRGLGKLPYNIRYTSGPRRAKWAGAKEWMFRFQVMNPNRTS